MSDWPYPSPDVVRHEGAVILEEISKVYATSLEQAGQYAAAQAIRALAKTAIPAIRKGDPDWLPPHCG